MRQKTSYPQPKTEVCKSLIDSIEQQCANIREKMQLKLGILGKRVLIADDEEGFRESLKAVLSSKGYEVVTAADGEECLDQLEENDIGLLLLDNRMPKITGAGVLRIIRNCSLPIAIMTGNPDDCDLVAAVRRFPRRLRIFVKPFRMEELCRFVALSLPVS